MSKLFAALTCAVVSIGVAGSGAAEAADLGGSTKDAAPVYEAEPFQHSSPFYFALRGGFSFPEDTEFGLASAGSTVTIEYDSYGYFIAGAAGMALGNYGWVSMRGDVELGYRNADVKTHNASGIGSFSGGDASGKTNITYGLANLYADFNTGSWIKPYVTAGGGLGRVSFDNHSVLGFAPALNDGDTGYAFQAGAGLSFEMGQGFDVELGYRYLAVYDIDVVAVDGTRSNVDVKDHQLLLGVRKKF